MQRAPAIPCEYCDGTVRQRKVIDDYWTDEGLVIIEDVPVGVCDRCGERYYDARVLQEMARIAGRRGAIERTIQVPITRFDATA